MNATTARFPYVRTRQATFPLPESRYRNAAKNGFCHRTSHDTPPETCQLPAVTDGDLQLPVIMCNCCGDLQLPVLPTFAGGDSHKLKVLGTIR